MENFKLWSNIDDSFNSNSINFSENDIDPSIHFGLGILTYDEFNKNPSYLINSKEENYNFIENDLGRVTNYRSFLSKKRERNLQNLGDFNNFEISKEKEEKQGINFNLNNVNNELLLIKEKLNIKEGININLDSNNSNNQLKKENNYINENNNNNLDYNSRNNELGKEKQNIKEIKENINDNQQNLFIIIDSKEEKEKIFKIEKDKKKGRKKKGVKTGNHTKGSEDNKILKIKAFFGKKIYIFLRDKIKRKMNKKLLKLEKSINKNLKKDFNMKLFNQSLGYIYKTYNISNKYLTEDKIENGRIHKKRTDKSQNEKLINKIYKENKEKDIIHILNLTYMDLFQILIRKKDVENKKEFEGFPYIEDFKEKIIEEEKEKGENESNINKYVEEIVDLCNRFENWFINKVGRNR